MSIISSSSESPSLNPALPTDTSKELDCRRLNCPRPILDISKKMHEVMVGGQLKIFADDAAFKADLAAWIRRSGNELVSFDTTPTGEHCAVIKRTH